MKIFIYVYFIFQIKYHYLLDRQATNLCRELANNSLTNLTL